MHAFHESQWGSGGEASSRRRLEIWGRSFQPLKTGGLKAEPPALGDFYDFFNKSNAFLAYLGLNFCLEHALDNS